MITVILFGFSTGVCFTGYFFISPQSKVVTSSEDKIWRLSCGSSSVALKLSMHQNHPGGLLKHRLLSPPSEFLIQSVQGGLWELAFLMVPRWCWCCYFAGHALRTTAPYKLLAGWLSKSKDAKQKRDLTIFCLTAAFFLSTPTWLDFCLCWS